MSLIHAVLRLNVMIFSSLSINVMEIISDTQNDKNNEIRISGMNFL